MIATGRGCGCSEPVDMMQASSAQRYRCRRVLQDKCGRSEEEVLPKEKVAQRNVEVIGSWCFGNSEVTGCSGERELSIRGVCEFPCKAAIGLLCISLDARVS
jgi:hypothetical protein